MDDHSHTSADKRRVAPSRDPLLAVIEPALKVGAACGGAGFLCGGAAGILKGTAPFLFASASGLQTFALGTTFWGIRSGVLEAWTPQYQRPSQLTTASTISGGVTGGTIAFLFRGRSNVLPGAVMFSLFGFAGQVAYNSFSARRLVGVKEGPGFWRRMAEKSWSPVTVMSNEEYAERLREKMLKVDVEIAIIDDKIEALRTLQREENGKVEVTVTPEN